MLRIATTSQLKKIIADGERRGYSRLPVETLAARLANNGKHLLAAYPMPDGDLRGFLRCYVHAKIDASEPATFWLDVHESLFSELQEAYPEDQLEDYLALWDGMPIG